MCGIVGGIGYKTWNTDKLLSSISHRGPDSNGYFLDSELFLGHTRLSILDLSENANQPMFSEDRRYVIVFNGEIYNHLEIRADLEIEHNFKSSGDTETILYAYIKYGPEFLERLNGIFALVIYDSITREIFIARDQIGVKPLYIYQDSNCFLFASEIKAFLSCNINKELNPEAFANYLTFLWSPGSAIPFKHVTRLLPGHYLKFKMADFRTTKSVKYYQLAFTGKYSPLSELQLINILEEKLIKAVKRQMLSDVPVGFFLSGGLDSSLIVAIAKKLYPEVRYPCFTINTEPWNGGMEDFKLDLYFAKKVAELLKVDLHIVNADLEIVKDFDKMIWHLDEPQSDAAPLNVMNIAALAKSRGIKVLLSGAGGDDLFSGYRRHQAINNEKYFRLLPVFIRKLITNITRSIATDTIVLRRIKKGLKDIDKTTSQRMAGYFHWLPSDVMKSIFSAEWKEKLEKYNSDQYFEILNLEIPEEKSPLNRMLYWEMKTFLVDHNLNYTDKMSMSTGVEVRVPLLDMELIEFSQIIPPELKMKGHETKYILRKVAERYLPPEVIYRPKTGFGAPIRKWVINDLDEMINERLSPERIKNRGLFDAEKVWQLINDNKKGKIDASYSIWSLLAIESWMQQFVDNQQQTL
jgi:asparagine synthase (glutamine-hydrolysing)